MTAFSIALFGAGWIAAAGYMVLGHVKFMAPYMKDDKQRRAHFKGFTAGCVTSIFVSYATLHGLPADENHTEAAISQTEQTQQDATLLKARL